LDARFELDERGVVKHFDAHGWAWDDNPFVGTERREGHETQHAAGREPHRKHQTHGNAQPAMKYGYVSREPGQQGPSDRALDCPHVHSQASAVLRLSERA